MSRRGSGLRPWLGSDAGSGTVLGLVVLAMMCFVTAVGVARAQQVLAIRQASIAADLAALAGAQGMDDPCGRAGSVAAANGVRSRTQWSFRKTIRSHSDEIVSVFFAPPELARFVLYSVTRSNGIPITLV